MCMHKLPLSLSFGSSCQCHNAHLSLTSFLSPSPTLLHHTLLCLSSSLRLPFVFAILSSCIVSQQASAQSTVNETATISSLLLTACWEFLESLKVVGDFVEIMDGMFFGLCLFLITKIIK